MSVLSTIPILPCVALSSFSINWKRHRVKKNMFLRIPIRKIFVFTPNKFVLDSRTGSSCFFHFRNRNLVLTSALIIGPDVARNVVLWLPRCLLVSFPFNVILSDAALLSTSKYFYKSRKLNWNELLFFVTDVMF